MIDSKLMENDTESPREGTSSFIFVFLTLGDSAVCNMDSKQFYCDKPNRNLTVKEVLRMKTIIIKMNQKSEIDNIGGLSFD